MSFQQCRVSRYAPTSPGNLKSGLFLGSNCDPSLSSSCKVLWEASFHHIPHCAKVCANIVSTSVCNLQTSYIYIYLFMFFLVYLSIYLFLLFIYFVIYIYIYIYCGMSTIGKETRMQPTGTLKGLRPLALWFVDSRNECCCPPEEM